MIPIFKFGMRRGNFIAMLASAMVIAAAGAGVTAERLVSSPSVTSGASAYSRSPSFSASSIGRIYSERRLFKRKSYGRAGPLHARGNGDDNNSPMLRVECKVGNSRLDAFVDTGAQVTVMSLECAQRCGLMSLVDRRFTGNAKGVGSTRIVGRIDGIELILGPPAADGNGLCPKDAASEEEEERAYELANARRKERRRLQKGGRFFSGKRSLPAGAQQSNFSPPEPGQVRLRNARLMILEDLDLDMLIGMDLLRQGDCEICISKNVLRFTQSELVDSENGLGGIGENDAASTSSGGPYGGYGDSGAIEQQQRVVVEVPFVEDAKQIKVATVQASHSNRHEGSTTDEPSSSSSSSSAAAAAAAMHQHQHQHQHLASSYSTPSSSATDIADDPSSGGGAKKSFDYGHYGRPTRLRTTSCSKSILSEPVTALERGSAERRARLPPPPPRLNPSSWGRTSTSSLTSSSSYYSFAGRRHYSSSAAAPLGRGSSSAAHSNGREPAIAPSFATRSRRGTGEPSPSSSSSFRRTAPSGGTNRRGASTSYATAAGRRLAEKDFLGRREARRESRERRNGTAEAARNGALYSSAAVAPTGASGVSDASESEPMHLAAKLRELRDNNSNLQGM